MCIVGIILIISNLVKGKENPFRQLRRREGSVCILRKNCNISVIMVYNSDIM